MKPFLEPDETKWKQLGLMELGTKGASRRLGGLKMNHSIQSADRATHLKIVLVALLAGVAVATFGMTARSGVDYSQTVQVIKAGKPVAITSSDSALVR